MQGCGKQGVLVLVVYTGKETKLVLNQGAYKYKTSNTEVNLNLIFLMQIVQIVILCTIFANLHAAFMKDNRLSTEYLFEGIESDALYSAGLFFSYFIILTRWIPFDLIMQSETGKIIYSKFIEWDWHMATLDGETGELVHCQVQSMQLPEQLGEIDHIFCDKTGTLTQNDLDVKALCIDGVDCRGETRSDLNEDVMTKCAEPDKILVAKYLFQCFCLCHDVRVISQSQAAAKDSQTKYDGASQDEILLIKLAQESALFELTARD